MTPSRRRTAVVICVAALAGVGAGAVIGVVGEDEDEPSADVATTAPPAAQAPPADGVEPERPGKGEKEPKLPPPEKDPTGAEPGPSGPPPESSDEQAAATAARGYVQALDRRAGGAVCRSFAPGALDDVDFPEPRGSCGGTVAASLGLRRRGLPVWEHSQMTSDVSAKIDGDSAKVVATVFTTYADIREPTIEDDIIYLMRDGDQWLVAKPSLTLYRAIGDADPPPSLLTPP
jgi:hypothetical protein